MRLVAAPDGVLDQTDRALWLWPPFDVALIAITTAACRTLTVPAPAQKLTVTVEPRRLEVVCE